MQDWREKPEAISDNQIKDTVDVDIVVIGAGHAGTSAARAASEAGARVAVVEQQNGENQWVLGMGEIGHINSQWQERHGVPKVDIDEFVEDWQKRTNNRSNYRLIRKYAEHCGEAFDWFIEPLSPEEQDSFSPMFTPQSPNFPATLNGFHA